MSNPKRSRAIFLNLEPLPCPPYLLSKKAVADLNDRRVGELASGIDRRYNSKVYSKCFDLIKKRRSPLRILDFGCGEGQFGNWLLETGAASGIRIYGVDIRAIPAGELPRNYCYFGQIRYNQGVPTGLNVRFDACVALFVFHFKVYERQLIDIRRHLKVGGLLVFNTLNYTSPHVHEKIQAAGFFPRSCSDVPRGASHHQIYCYERAATD